MIKFLAGLYKSGQLQVHHLRAAEWIRCQPRGSAGLSALKLDCIETERRNPQFKGDVYAAISRVCRGDGTFPVNDLTLGVMREALNAANRLRMKEIAAQRKVA